MQCPECTTEAARIAETVPGEHWQCQNLKCHAIFGWQPLPPPHFFGATRMTYHHSSAEVLQLEGLMT